jgi:NADH dehydrogenase [ubiquinone] 1 alpha subcomplex assembly factor 7
VSELDPNTQISTPLAEKIKARIRRDGPISVAEYMELCLHDCDDGYYRTQKAIGANADFITAPEISQVFGELIGIWAAVTWRAFGPSMAGAPNTLRLVEIGPGRGTLMLDALRAASVVPGFLEATRVHMIESNPHLERIQRQRLAAYGEQITWHEDVGAIQGALPASVPHGPTILLANEYFDTAPCNQWVARGGQWNLRVVDLVDDLFVFADQAVASHMLQRPTGNLPADGTIRQGPGSRSELEVANFHTRACFGPLAMLVIDYGFTGDVTGDTLQAMSAHTHVSPFRAPGLDDVTAHVDFGRLKTQFQSTKAFDVMRGFKGARGPDDRSPALIVDGPITQTEFLLKMGLVERAQALMRQARPEQVNGIETGARRIADPDGMGGLFKVMAVRSPGLPVLPPFAVTTEGV